MSLFDNVLARFGYSKAQPRPPSELMALADGYRWDIPDASVAEKQAKLYAMSTWIATAVDRVAEIGAAAVFSVAKTGALQDSETDDEDVPNHPFELLLRKPNPSQSRGEFMRAVLSWRKTAGNAYIFKNTPSENVAPSELWVVPSTMIVPVPDGQSFIKGYKFTPPNGQPIALQPWEIVHLKSFNPFNPFVGLSDLQSLALDALADIEQQKWNYNLFGKNAGKFPGIVAFKHLIPDPEWNKLLRQRDEEWGGNNRASAMMLRGVGDLVQYIPAAATQKEMEFLAGRAFNKEEVYGKLAPGLASILAVNATEANAIAGKATLIEFGVWPLLEELAQKFTAELLPLYGENLVGAFDDLRQTNRILDLQEQEAYERTHTVNEVRAEYYGDDPLYLDKTQVDAMAEEEKQTEERNTQALEMLNKPKPPVFGKADTETSEAPTKELDPRGLMFVAQIGPATPLPGEKKPAPPPMLPPANQQPGDAMQDQAAPNDGQAEEMAKWEKFALARVGKGGRAFEPRVLPMMQAARIAAGLKAAATPDDVRAVFKRERDEPSLVEVGQRLTAAIEKATAKL
jgi:phage portal protein BeeE